MVLSILDVGLWKTVRLAVTRQLTGILAVRGYIEAYILSLFIIDTYTCVSLQKDIWHDICTLRKGIYCYGL